MNSADCLALALSCAAGAGVVLSAWPGRGDARAWLMRGCLAVGIGMGASSAVFFLWLWMGPIGGRGLLGAMDVGVAAIAVAIAWWRRGVRGDVEAMRAGGWSAGALLTGLLLIAASVAAVLSIYSQLAYAMGRPHGEWDAFAIWNLRARFLFRGGAEWRAGFGPELSWSHPDYPLLLPAAVARLWTYAGGDATTVPQGLAFGATGLVIATLFAGLAWLRGWAAAAIGVIVLLASTSFDILGTTQCADVPLAWAMLATLMLLAGALRTGAADGGLMLLAGAAAGMAAWTKNEGALFAAAAAVSVAVCAGRAYGWRRGLSALGVFAAGAVPFVGCLLVQKAFLAGASDLAAGNSAALIRKHVLDAGRHGQIWRAFAALWVDHVDRWAMGLAAACAVTAIVFGRTRGNRGSGRLRYGVAVCAILLTLGLQGLGYYAVYLVTPHDLHWQLRTSVHRVFVQVWPSVVFAVVWLTPELRIAKSEERKRWE